MKSVLIIDDEPGITMLLEELLTDEGYRTYVAHDGGEGLALLDRFQEIGLVLIDLNMPGKDGKATIREIREGEGRHQELPIIVITGAVEESGDYPPPGTYQALIAKPFQLDQVVEEVKKYLN